LGMLDNDVNSLHLPSFGPPLDLPTLSFDPPLPFFSPSQPSSTPDSASALVLAQNEGLASHTQFTSSLTDAGGMNKSSLQGRRGRQRDQKHFAEQPDNRGRTKKTATRQSGDVYLCPFPGCQQSFTIKKSLLRHMNTAERHASVSTPKYQCCCGREFARKDKYMRHNPGLCGGLLPYKCSCGRIDTMRDSHLAHYARCGEKKRGRPTKSHGKGAISGAENYSGFSV
jgi:hypothetical protein